nr:hypothetical protein [uncultured Peptostreptococcus sp.]
MGRRKREPMNPAKKNIISELIKTYDGRLYSQVEQLNKKSIAILLC